MQFKDCKIGTLIVYDNTLEGVIEAFEPGNWDPNFLRFKDQVAEILECDSAWLKLWWPTLNEYSKNNCKWFRKINS